MEIKLDKRFKKHAQGRYEKYEFTVGVLEDGPHLQPKPAKDGHSNLAGVEIRKKSRKPGPLTIAEVSEANRERMKVNYLTAPFKKRSSDIIKFANEFFKLTLGNSEKKRAENLLQAVVRNPILRGDYPSNSKVTQKIKGFDHRLIDTGQLFKAIKAICTIKGKS